MLRIPVIFLAIAYVALPEHPYRPGVVSAAQLLPSISISTGVEPEGSITYARIALSGKRLSPDRVPPSGMAPLLIAQCTRDTTGKLHFELRANYTGLDDGKYHLPWRKSWPGHISPPRPARFDVVLEFFGYTRAKPLKRQWELERDPPTEMLYLAPGFHSHNLDEASTMLQYMRSLPTLHLTHDHEAAEFETGVWLAALHDEPLCAAAGI